MITLRTTGLLLIWLAVGGCGDWGPDGVDVWRQRVPGSSAVIYHVDASYNNTISGNFASGLVFADSADTLPHDYDYLGGLTPYVAITGVRHGGAVFVSWVESPADISLDTSRTAYTRPVSSESFRVGGADFENLQYRGRANGQPCRLQQYEYSRFEERADSLVVYDLTWRDRAPVARKAFPKGGIKATLDDGGFVAKLEIEEFIAGVYPGYRTEGHPYELTDGPTACSITYRLTHEGAEQQRISDYGVFKLLWSCKNEEEC